MVSVSNGEAAVRKLPDFPPDLVLADIFMPVRNGYEVCEFVKKDSRFSHVPVVLLVGAFDPLDEREAQRVGADGILKKPFVPPDPLITMVKTLLDRTLGERLVAVPVSHPAVAVLSRANAGPVADAPLPAPDTSEESMEIEPLRPISSSAFEEGERPVAFGQLLDSPERDSAAPALEPVDNEQVLTSQRDATLGDPIFWRNDTPEPETESTDADDSASLDLHNWSPTEDTLSRREDAAPLQPVEPLELVRDGQEAPSPSIVESGSILLDAASQASLTVEPGKPEDLAANPIEWMATAPPEHAEEPADPIPGWDEEIPSAQNTIDLEDIALPEPAPLSLSVPEPLPEKAVPPAHAPALTPVRASDIIVEKSPDAAKAQPFLSPSSQTVATQNAPAQTAPGQSAEDTARSIPQHDWTDLAAMLHTADEKTVPEGAAPEVAAEKAAPVTAKPVEFPPVTEPVSRVSAIERIAPAPATPPVAPKSAPEPAAQVTAFKQMVEPLAPKISQPAPASPAKPSSPDPALVEAVVQRVLDKMRPQVVEIITKEFLRPIVEALVHREIKKQ